MVGLAALILIIAQTETSTPADAEPGSEARGNVSVFDESLTPVRDPPSEPAAPVRAKRFGLAGQKVIDGDVNASLTRTGYSLDGPAVVAIRLHPSMSYFIVDDFALGAAVSLEFAKSGNTSAFGYGIAAAAHYNIHMSETFSLLPSVELGYGGTVVGNGVDRTAVTFGLALPMIIQIVEHVFAGLGPVLSTELVSNFGNADGPKATLIGFALTIGAWW